MVDGLSGQMALLSPDPLPLPAQPQPLSMHISRLQLIQFRNYAELSLDFSPGINGITGPNGSGKTNLLDALHYLAFTRGFRSSSDQQAVQEGESFFFTLGMLQRADREEQIQCNFVKGKGKKLLVNQTPLTRMSDHIGEIPLVAVLPQDTELINGPSAGRRQFLDMLISQYDRAYLRHLIQYNRLLSQRNALLRLMGEQRYFDPEQVTLYDEQLIPHGQAIHAGREQFLADFLPVFARYFRRIVSEKEAPSLRYRSQLDQNTPEAWLALFADKLEKDRLNQYSSVGIHRDDLVFQIDEHSVRHFGSQGQQKTFVIALKLAQYELLAELTQRPPLLLLDDLFDKLDRHRLGQIADLLLEEIRGQVFITDTAHERLASLFPSEAQRPVQFFSVKQGKVEPEG
jgi:DNA replication and repair protein RecF